MPSHPMSGTTAVVTGAGRGFGRAIAAALCGAGAHVVGLATDGGRLEEVRAQLGAGFTPVTGDAADPYTAAELIDRYEPTVLVLNAGAPPLTRPLHQQTWQSFSRSWEVDVQQTFNWTREALLRPLAPGSTVIAMSSGAALQGSPLSGGYAGAKATVRFIASYAALESERERLGIRFLSVLPKLTPATRTGEAGLAAYAERSGTDVATFLERFGPTLTVEQVGEAVRDLVTEPAAYDKGAYLLTSGGLDPLG